MHTRVRGALAREESSFLSSDITSLSSRNDVARPSLRRKLMYVIIPFSTGLSHRSFRPLSLPSAQWSALLAEIINSSVN